jgi:hypothetical protein
MFHTECTEIDPRLGNTMKRLLLAQQFKSHYNYNLRDVDVGHDYICCNPFAVKVLEQWPSLVDCDVIFDNPSGDALELMYQNLQYSITPQTHIAKICSVRSPLLDNYLQKIPKKDLYNKKELSRNPYAVPFLRKNPRLINWVHICANPEALDLIEANQYRIFFSPLSENTNPRAIEILRQHPDKIDWVMLSMNSCNEAIDLLLENQDKINWLGLSQNRNPLILPFLEANIDKVHHFYFSANPIAFEILMRHPEYIYWPSFCANASKKEHFDFLRNNIDKVEWDGICLNPNKGAVDLLAEHPDRINWTYAINHMNVFETTAEYNYEGIRNARRDLHEVFHAWAGHPSKMTTKWRDWGFDDAVVDDAEEEDETNQEPTF